MIRPFDWRDLGLLNRTRDQGLCLNSELAYTRGPNTIQTLLLDILTPGRTAFTLVVRPSEKDEPAAIGQILHRAGEPHALLTFVGPVEALSSPSSGLLLDALGKAAGERGAHHLIAEVDELSPIFENVRKAGFAIYTRQRIWRLESTPSTGKRSQLATWRPEIEADESAINHLYLNTVPALVQQVELPPHLDRDDLVHWQEDELLGYLDIERGPRGVWVDPYFHPAVENMDELLESFLQMYSEHQKRPIYFSVRSYNGWVGHALDRIGFEPVSDQAVMVKRLAVTIRRPARSPLPNVEGTRPEPTTPFANMSQHKSRQSYPPASE